ncbi:MAG TPA: FG-GAP-like repeat-containing protein [Gammaproteobacteria bacterium]|nr:FG-GAP-like repeat-containing protein [Gammaproteobacteria bacterium]
MLIGVIGLAGGAASASTLYPQPVIRVAGGPTSTAVADFNGDGLADVAIAGYGAGDVTVLLGQGAGTFDAANYAVDHKDTVHPRAVTAADFDDDGAPDIAFVTQGSGDSTVNVLLNNGDGTFKTGFTAKMGTIAIGIASADLDGDGNEDVVTADIGSGNVSVFMGNGDGTLKSGKAFAAADGVNSVVLTDIDGDGDMDIVAAAGASQTVAVLLGNGSGGFAAAKTYPAGVAATALAVDDVTGDGKADAVVANGDEDQNGVSVLVGNGKGGFAPPLPLLATVSETSTVAIADLNGDGIGDIIAGNYDANASSISVLMATGKGAFKSHVDYQTGYSPFSLAVADFDGDGKQDVIAADSNNADVTLLSGQGNGKFQSHTTLQAGNDPDGVGIADVDGDGDMDIVVPNFGESGGTISVFLNDDNEGFAGKQDYPSGTAPNSVDVADVNGDGKVDVIVPNNDAATVSVLLNAGGGAFESPVPYATGDFPIALAVGDVNGDGNADLVVANDILPPKSGGAAPPGSVSVLLGAGDGTFGAKTDYATAPGPVSVAIGDLNGDDRPDIVTADYFAGDVSVLLNNGDGFDAQQTYSTADKDASASYPQSVAIGDFDEDGDADVVAANRGNSDVAVFLGDGTGKLGAAKFYPTGPVPYDLALLDYNEDGHTDIATANLSGSSISLLAGNGDGTFGDNVEYLVGTNPLGIAAADINGDDSIDLVVANGATDNVTVMPQSEAAPIAKDISLTVKEGSKASGVFAGIDQNGDKLTYKVVDQPSHGTVSVDGSKFTYTPDSGYSGEDSFTYQANDGSLNSNTATVSITIQSTGGGGDGGGNGGSDDGGGAGGPLGLALLGMLAIAVGFGRKRR